MNKIFQILLLSIVVSCSTTEGLDNEKDPPITEPNLDGIWIIEDDKHSANLLETPHNIYNRGTYTLKITSKTENTTTADWEWTVTKPAYLTITPNQTDSSKITVLVKGPNNSTDVTYSITAKSKNASKEYKINFNAKAAKAPSTQTINGKTATIRSAGIDNFNNAMYSTNTANGFWLPGHSGTGSKRYYWNKDAIVFENNVVNLQTRKGKPSDERYSADGWSVGNKANAPGKPKTHWISGSLHRRGTQGFGYYEARIKMQKKSSAHWDAFWAYESPKGKPVGSEIKNDSDIWYEYDMMEYTKTGSGFDQTTHWWKKGGSPRVIDPSKTQVSSIAGKSNLEEWFTLGLYWDGKEAIYFVNGKETIRVKANGGSSTGTHGVVTAADLDALFAQKGSFAGTKEDLAVSPFTGLNFKFTTELGVTYRGNTAADVTEFEGLLQKDLGDDGFDSFYIDYYTEYDLK